MSFRNAAPPHYRRNAFCLAGDYVLFGVGMAFFSLSTVLPSFVRQLTDSAVMVGLANAFMNGGWLLPQLLAARWVRRCPMKKRFAVVSGLIGRPTFWISAAIITLFGRSRPELVLVTFYAGFLLFALSDGVCSVAWFELLAKCVPVERRGRVVGTGQVILGTVSLGIAATISYLLGPTSGLDFPRNYALLFTLAGFALMVSLLCIGLIREPEGDDSPTEVHRPGYRHLLRDILSHDRTFVILVVTRLLLGFAGMGHPFYVLHATEVLALGAQSIGLFTLAQTGAGILGGITLGYLHERRGSAAVVQISIVLGLLIPVLALVAHTLAGGPVAILLLIYVLLFVAIGLLNSSFMLGFIARYLEIAPEGERAVYMGLANTLNALCLPATLVGGWILQMTSYPTLFVAAAGFALVSVAFGSRASRRGENARPSSY